MKWIWLLMMVGCIGRKEYTNIGGYREGKEVEVRIDERFSKEEEEEIGGGDDGIGDDGSDGNELCKGRSSEKRCEEEDGRSDGGIGGGEGGRESGGVLYRGVVS